jgi:hypothetical protein
VPITHADLVTLLKRELLFLERGGYRSTPYPWRPPLLIEDSQTCPRKAAGENCLEKPCPWLAFVALKHQRDEIPCRHIAVGTEGETIDLLYRTATREEYEETFRKWLVAAIQRLEQLAA